MDKPRILIQLDSDPHASVFDRVVAVDAGVEHLFSYSGVRPDEVQALVHGAIFTRGPKDLHRTAIFVGGSDVRTGEAILAEVRRTLMPKYGLSVSVMLDSNGCNTTAAAAVRAASRHMDLASTGALVLGGTGPVGQRVARLLARQGADVAIGSRQIARAEEVCSAIRQTYPHAKIRAVSTATAADAPGALEGRTLAIAAGAAGVVLLPSKVWTAAGLRLVIDLNAVPPLGIEGVDAGDAGVDCSGTLCYGAIGVGGTKMKIHRAAIAGLFESNKRTLDAEEIYDLASTIH